MTSRSHPPTNVILAGLGAATLLVVVVGFGIHWKRSPDPPRNSGSRIDATPAARVDQDGPEPPRPAETEPRPSSVGTDRTRPPSADDRESKVVKLVVALEGGLLMHDSVDSKTFRVSITQPNGTHKHSVPLLQDGRFRLFRAAQLPPRIDVVVTLHETGEVLARVSDVRIPSGAPTKDRRVLGIDVSRVWRCRLSFLGADDTPLYVRGHAQLVAPNGQGVRHVYSGENGKVSLLTTSRTLRADVWAAGFLSQRIVLDASRPVRLRTGHRIDVQRVPELMSEAQGFPPPPRVWLRPVDGYFTHERGQYRPDLQRQRDRERELLPLSELTLEVVDDLPHGAQLDGFTDARRFYSITRPLDVEVGWSIGRTEHVVEKFAVTDVTAPPRVVHVNVNIDPDALDAATQAWQRDYGR